MSIKAMAAVWEYSEQSGSSLLMLLAIADYAHDDGTNAWPSLATLARKTRMTRGNVIRTIKKLEKASEIHVNRNGGKHKSNEYSILC